MVPAVLTKDKWTTTERDEDHTLEYDAVRTRLLEVAVKKA